MAAKQKDLRTFEERTRELQRQIEAQEHQNGGQGEVVWGERWGGGLPREEW